MRKEYASELNRLAKKGVFKSVDLDPDWYQKHLEEEKGLKEEARKKEEDRIKKLNALLADLLQKIMLSIERIMA